MKHDCDDYLFSFLNLDKLIISCISTIADNDNPATIVTLFSFWISVWS